MSVVSGPLPTGNGSMKYEASTAAVSIGETGAAGTRAGNGIGDRGSAVGHLGESGRRDAAWMPPLTELPERAFQYQIELSVDQETGRVVARVIDRESGEVVRQVPPDYVLQLAMYIDAWLGRVLDAHA